MPATMGTTSIAPGRFRHDHDQDPRPREAPRHDQGHPVHDAHDRDVRWAGRASDDDARVGPGRFALVLRFDRIRASPPTSPASPKSASPTPTTAQRTSCRSTTGRARQIDDDAKARKLWNPALKAWFPDGLEDPKLALIEVQIELAGYWDAPDNRFVRLAGILAAAATGNEYDAGEVGHVENVAP